MKIYGIQMNSKEKELLTGMGNCYDVCGEDFDATVGMVSSTRGREPEEVKDSLQRIKNEYGQTKEYQQLRSRLPEDFPL